MQASTPTGSATAASPQSSPVTAQVVHGPASVSTIKRSALAGFAMAPVSTSPMRSLNLPGLTELVTPAGKKQLYVIDPESFGRYMVMNSDLTLIRRKVEDLLGSPSSEVQISFKSDIINMKSNSLAKEETGMVVDSLLKHIALQLPSLI